MGNHWAPPNPTARLPFLTDFRHTELIQQRCYLMSTLAHENARAQQTHHRLHHLNISLQETLDSEAPAEDVENLEKVITGTKRKLKRCGLNQKAISGNIAAVNIRIQILEQHQWRKNQLQYSHTVQPAAPLEIISGYREYSMPFVPSSTSYEPPLLISPQTPLLSPAGIFTQLLPMTPPLQPQFSMAPASAWNTPLGTPYHDQFRFPSNQGPSICLTPPDTVDHLTSQIEQLHVSLKDRAPTHTRSMSMPNLSGVKQMQF